MEGGHLGSSPEQGGSGQGRTVKGVTTQGPYHELTCSRSRRTAEGRTRFIRILTESAHKSSLCPLTLGPAGVREEGEAPRVAGPGRKDLGPSSFGRPRAARPARPSAAQRSSARRLPGHGSRRPPPDGRHRLKLGVLERKTVGGKSISRGLDDRNWCPTGISVDACLGFTITLQIHILANQHRFFHLYFWQVHRFDTAARRHLAQAAEGEGRLRAPGGGPSV
ncbi:partner of Y14 and mago isoform X1 [Ochotona princeps]|uniref:partner of Y14 and mago isoform X1 n=1 Tax=Ochotona princeps TaxID=9978 RepID=UPI0027155DC9|nr:partner of Y14 and mago isoform X1 [Ochotona princeps]